MIGMTDKEQLIRVKILPRLENLSDSLFNYHDDGTAKKIILRELDKITKELVTILNE